MNRTNACATASAGKCLLLAAALCLAAARPVVAGPVGKEKPNFVFILIDDLGWTDAGCCGSTFYQTPNIDRWPGAVAPGSISRVPVVSVDFYPTILDVAGARGTGARLPRGRSTVRLFWFRATLRLAATGRP